MMKLVAAVLAFVAAFGLAPAAADMRSDAVRLLAHRVRQAGVDPRAVDVSGVVVVDGQALFSWSAGKLHGLTGLIATNDRWWDALDMLESSGCWSVRRAYPLAAALPYPAPFVPAELARPDSQTLLSYGLKAELVSAAAVRNPDVMLSDASRAHCSAEMQDVAPDTAVRAAGGTIHPPRAFTSGYDLTISYAKNDARADTSIKQLYVRPPTPAEFLPNHPVAPGWGSADAVAYFDLAIAGAQSVAVDAGSTIDLWFPFVLDDQLQYNLSFLSDDRPSGIIHGAVFDNTVHFVLTAFVLAPEKPLMAEVDGDPKPRS